MKKLSLILISCICFLSFLLTGCTYADNATLTTISEKYGFIANNNEKIFDGESFRPTYDNVSLLQLINSTNKNYNILKTDTNRADYSNNGAYGILMSAINSTYLSNNALNILTNNELTEKQYKKAMYESLESLEKNVKSLTSTKKSLESVFINDERDALVVNEQDLTKYNLNKYLNSLNASLTDLLKFNRNYNLALTNNIVKPVELNDLLYGSNVNLIITKEYNNQLINTANILISNFILSYDAKVLENVSESEELLNILVKLLNRQYVLKSEETTSEDLLVKYKVIRTLESSIIHNEEVFINNINGLNSKNINNENNAYRKDYINFYKNSLINYGNKLVNYLENF